MRWKYVGNKKDTGMTVFNNDDTVTILAGGPVFLKPDGTTPGKSAVSAESLAAARQGFFFGFAIANTGLLADGEAQVFGMFDYARVMLCSRSATSATWASYAALAVGDIMSIVTIAGVQAISQSGAGSASAAGWDIQLGASLPSQTTQASSLGPVGSYWTTQLRVLVQCM